MYESTQEKIFKELISRINILEEKNYYYEEVLTKLISENKNVLNLATVLAELLVKYGYLKSREISNEIMIKLENQTIEKQKEIVKIISKINEDKLMNSDKFVNS